MKPLKVIIYGLFPTIYSTCAPCCSYDYFSACAPKNNIEQLNEYPKWMVSQQDIVVKMVNELSVYGNYLNIEVISADSLRGIILGLRYRLGNGPAVIINGKVFKGGELALEHIKKYIEEQLRQAVKTLG